MARYSIGRDAKCDIQIADDSVSRHHAELIDQGRGTYLLRDLESANGTFSWDGSGFAPVGDGASVGKLDRVSLGTYRTTVRELIARAENPERRDVRQSMSTRFQEILSRGTQTEMKKRIRNLIMAGAACLTGFAAVVALAVAAWPLGNIALIGACVLGTAFAIVAVACFYLGSQVEKDLSG